jgi:hypothetical protein
MEQNPTLTNATEAPKRPAPTRPQLWLLGGTVLIGILFDLWMLEQGRFSLYCAFWLVTLAVFVGVNWKRVLLNKTVLALIVPVLALCGLVSFRPVDVDLLDWAMLAIPALLLTIGVFTTQEISYKREGKAVLGVLRAVFVKPFTAIGAYFLAFAGLFRTKERTSAKHGWLGLAVGLPLMVVVLALLASADAGMQKLLGGLFEQVSIWEWFWRVVVVLVSSMLIYSLFYNLTWGKPDADLLPVRQNWKLAGPGVVIGLLLFAYALFTYVQFTYLFGKTLPVAFTYSQYAREGFDQFLVVTLINFTVLGVSLVKSEQGRAIKVLQALLIAASLIVLASAAWRMLLYVGAYGLTIRRVLPLWLMLYFAFLAVVGVVRVYRERTPFLRIGAFALVYWFVVLLCIDWSTLMNTFNFAHGFGG